MEFYIDRHFFTSSSPLFNHVLLCYTLLEQLPFSFLNAKKQPEVHLLYFLSAPISIAADIQNDSLSL
ncbi:hypothetical protein VU13_03260 [Desulfobulbus sp. US5]|nr:hypothetical protein [Desulfobulbus sp. US5]